MLLQELQSGMMLEKEMMHPDRKLIFHRIEISDNKNVNAKLDYMRI